MTEKYILVTGGAQNIGKAISKRLTEDGFQIIILDIKEPSHEYFTEFNKIDLSDAATVQSCLAELSAKYSISGLVNNVGIVVPASMEDVTLDDFERVLNTNARSAMLCTQALLPKMRQQKFGRIVSTVSRVVLGKELRTSYCASKGAVLSMSRTWALEMAKYGITINCIAPGPIATSTFWENNPPNSSRAKEIMENIPMKRMGNPDDIAHATSYFMDERSGFVTGQVLYVCGGLTVGLAGL
jgi:NAD(P)-dependent dehydrogenase (short-subunit alcohol dehydrogenase family)